VTHKTLEATTFVPSRPSYATVCSSYRLDSSVTRQSASPSVLRVRTVHCHRTQDVLSVQTSKLRSTLLLSLPQQLRHRFSGRTQCAGSRSGSRIPIRSLQRTWECHQQHSTEFYVGKERVTPCRLLNASRRFEGTCQLHSEASSG
jgi:hypothetical protein